LAGGGLLVERENRSLWGVSEAIGFIVMYGEDVVTITQPNVPEVIAAVSVSGRRKCLENWLKQRWVGKVVARLTEPPV
jgi:hypothetical protein